MVRKKVKEYLWIPEKHACYDRDKNNIFMDILLHNNLRCMYYGAFDQDMADAFIKFHLLNPEEFWTSVPLPSIAVNDSDYVQLELAEHWINQISEKFLDRFSSLRKVGTFSNGESIYEYK